MLLVIITIIYSISLDISFGNWQQICTAEFKMFEDIAQKGGNGHCLFKMFEDIAQKGGNGQCFTHTLLDGSFFFYSSSTNIQ